MGLEYIRKYYGVPAKRGMRVRYRHANRLGTITGTRGGYIKIRLDGDKHSRSYHPTWQLDYLDTDGSVLKST